MNLTNTLDCSSISSAIASVASILDASEEELKSFLLSLGLMPDGIRPELFFRNLYDYFKKPEFPISSLWFHGTRTSDMNSFSARGILTKSEIKPILEKELLRLSNGICSVGDYRSYASYVTKNWVDDEGPFAFLIKGRTYYANFIDAPELIEDLAGSMFGGNYNELVSRFKEVSTPCVVTFRASADEEQFFNVLRFINGILHGDDERCLLKETACVFNGKGKSIPASEVVSVEAVSVGL